MPVHRDTVLEIDRSAGVIAPRTQTSLDEDNVADFQVPRYWFHQKTTTGLLTT